MYQPRLKLEFIRRYCAPGDGWIVYADVDPSELGRTGGARKNAASRVRQQQMEMDGAIAVADLEELGVTVGGSRIAWGQAKGVPHFPGDRDIVAFHPVTKRCLIAEVEGDSSGQPEGKVYKAVGQIVMAVGEIHLEDWTTQFVLVVEGERVSHHLGRARSLSKLGVSGLRLAKAPQDDHWLFGSPITG